MALMSPKITWTGTAKKGKQKTQLKAQATNARFSKLTRQLQQVSEKQKQLAKQNQGV